MDSIFKDYDIRGLYPDEITEDIAFRVGNATAQHLKSNTLVIGHDARPSSLSLAKKLEEGIQTAGCNTINIGPVTSPLFYFSVNMLQAEGGIMVTASHNPPQYNGFKIVGKDSISIGLENGLREIEELTHAEQYQGSQKGTGKETSLIQDYVNFLLEVSTIEGMDLGKMDIVIDAGNGMTSLILDPLLKKINVNATRMMFEVSDQPLRGSDVSKDENILELKRKVVEMNADCGVAFDGDGDRIAVVDNLGNRIRSDLVLALLCKEPKIPLKTVYDFRISKAVRDSLEGTPSRVGHSHIKEMMRENNADIGVELSGHFFFREMHYSESAILAMLKLLKVLALHRQPLSELVKPWLSHWHHSGEIVLDLLGRNPNQIIDSIKEAYPKESIDETDGITISSSHWWFNIRPSHTESVMRLVIEADSEEILTEKKKEISRLLEMY